MSLSVGAYSQGYPHPGPLGHEFYQYPQVRYPDPHTDAGYFPNWMLGAQEMPVSPDAYGMGAGSPPIDPTTHVVYYENGIRCVKRRITANKKERRRTQSINNAFASLRGCIPNVPSDTKLSKIKTLRLATSYIAYLMDVLAKDDPKLAEAGFKAELTKKSDRQKTEEEKKRKETPVRLADRKYIAERAPAQVEYDDAAVKTPASIPESRNPTTRVTVIPQVPPQKRKGKDEPDGRNTCGHQNSKTDVVHISGQSVQH